MHGWRDLHADARTNASMLPNEERAAGRLHQLATNCSLLLSLCCLPLLPAATCRQVILGSHPEWAPNVRLGMSTNHQLHLAPAAAC